MPWRAGSTQPDANFHRIEHLHHVYPRGPWHWMYLMVPEKTALVAYQMGERRCLL